MAPLAVSVVFVVFVVFTLTFLFRNILEWRRRRWFATRCLKDYRHDFRLVPGSLIPFFGSSVEELRTMPHFCGAREHHEGECRCWCGLGRII